MIYNASIEKFERKLRKVFPKFKTFSLTQAKKETGAKHIQLNKWLPELVRRKKLKTTDWTLYFFDRFSEERMEENVTELKKINGSAVNENEELKRKMRNMERDLNNWKMTVEDFDKIIQQLISKKGIVAS
ncbi:unnamed protein product [marine sediment metagenome]|uniref:Uncharacterized protein n=1 Tax=marine sediment metagenome TaxID=412755 RepID=X0SE38_9ZZZZ